MLLGVESHADSTLAGATSSASTMDVGVDFFWGFQLQDEVDFGDIETSGCYVGGYEALELTLLETMEGNLPLLLGDVAV